MSASATSDSTSAPTAVALYAKVVAWMKNGLDASLVPKAKGRNNMHPFARVLSDIAGCPNLSKEPDARAALRAFFVSMPDDIITTLTKEILVGIESILQQELADAEITDAAELIVDNVPSKTQYPVAVWRGDMTRLRCGAMVNPANGDLLGCFLPSHRCLDNIIMAQAGPQLRVACKKMKEDLGIDWDNNGECRVTPAFELPAQYVFHTVGPDLNEGRGYDKFVRKPNATDKKELHSCYETCIRAASERKVASVAFCCISTGVFGYPSDEATLIALNTTKAMLDELAKQGKHIPAIIFNTFLEKDYNLYLDGFKQVFGGKTFEAGNAKKKQEEGGAVAVAEEETKTKNKDDDEAAEKKVAEDEKKEE